ncbi:hypothetical protein [uncultured phage_MedDCM-OCT-S28-C10]|uniref:Uncharacterized protein n=1 Tax=uncultured phage_MedDCM-OCT-S28-C10 TaxID=2741077 RepID=A0A6S4PFY7_9CAUD|nr:hypothetical protein HOQ60_gp30 [uncultured phage_MedDCM-OCT-S28-C10]BAQ94073.1 hypothetical protein [uncultured phage_MedDCM-OCT-S28-C10]BAR25275.1 hypothetical protein [uncultured Mediterranean phage uvMED]BAR25314.1 hypothetical protein [uncultured Mediterranean phage uvMED]
MGNRVVIGIADENQQMHKDCIGIYLHWNGGDESINAFLKYAKKHKVRSDDYGIARLIQIIGNSLGGTLSMGVDRVSRLDCDNGDNGLVWINRKFEIIAQEHFRHKLGDLSKIPTDDTYDKWVSESNDIHFDRYDDFK